MTHRKRRQEKPDLGGLETLVRAGNLSEARRRLRDVRPKGIPRREALAYANLARRLDLAALSLEILNPIVRADGRRRSSVMPPATAEEKIEYAASLRKQGAVGEAEEILRGIDPGKVP